MIITEHIFTQRTVPFKKHSLDTTDFGGPVPSSRLSSLKFTMNYLHFSQNTPKSS